MLVFLLVEATALAVHDKVFEEGNRACEGTGFGAGQVVRSKLFYLNELRMDTFVPCTSRAPLQTKTIATCGNVGVCSGPVAFLQHSRIRSIVRNKLCHDRE